MQMNDFWLYVGLATASVIIVALTLYLCAWTWDNTISRMKHHRGGLACLTIVAVLIGGAKHYYGKVSFPYTDVEVRYLYDAGSYVTNDLVHVAYTKSMLVPSSAEIEGWYRPQGSTNDEEWTQFLVSTFDMFPSPQDIPFPGAETNDFQFFTTWTPGPTAHTNGVAMIVWQLPGDEEKKGIVMYRTGLYVEGVRVAPDSAITNGPTYRINYETMNLEENNEEDAAGWYDCMDFPARAGEE